MSAHVEGFDIESAALVVSTIHVTCFIDADGRTLSHVRLDGDRNWMGAVGMLESAKYDVLSGQLCFCQDDATTCPACEDEE